MPHKRLVMAFARDGVNLPRLSQCRGHTEFDISDKCFDCGKSSVAGGRAVTALLFQVSEKVQNQSGINLLDAYLGGLDRKPLTCKHEQKPKSMSVSLAGVGAATLFDRHVLTQEAGYQRGNRGHLPSLTIIASAASEMLIINSGVASRYQ